MPTFASQAQTIQVGNGKYTSVMFIIPIVLDIHGHRLKTFTLVSKIRENVDLVLVINNNNNNNNNNNKSNALAF